ncbi:MAG: lysophospholipid acyltransferase family protein [Cyclobacteriaceae bacterium]
MTRIAYYLIIKPLSLLPLQVLYFINWPFYVVVAYVVKYRKPVITRQLNESFPEKSDAEIRELRRKFYRHFVDVLIESLKELSISEKEIVRRFRLTNPEILEPFYKAGRNVAMVMGHQGNWEYSAALQNQMIYQFVCLYKPLKNKFLDKKIHDSRTKHGCEVISIFDIGKFVKAEQPNPYMLIFIADQDPPGKSKMFWTDFLNHETAVAAGAERYAKMLDMPVFFGHIIKVKRGHYEMTFELLEENPKEAPNGEITAKHTEALERNIMNNPAYWLWSHKRWKKKSRAEFEMEQAEKKQTAG